MNLPSYGFILVSVFFIILKVRVAGHFFTIGLLGNWNSTDKVLVRIDDLSDDSAQGVELTSLSPLSRYICSRLRSPLSLRILSKTLVVFIWSSSSNCTAWSFGSGLLDKRSWRSVALVGSAYLVLLSFNMRKTPIPIFEPSSCLYSKFLVLIVFFQ